MEEYKSDPAFDYRQDYAPAGSLLSRALMYVYDKLASWFGSPNVRMVAPWVFRVLLLLAIVFAVLLILRLRYGPLIRRQGARTGVEVPVWTHEPSVDYDRLYLEAVQQGQHSMAIRYLFLKALSVLNQQGALKLAHWKAPYDYLHELPLEKRGAFRQLTYLFEASWYGDYPTGEAVVAEAFQLKNELGKAAGKKGETSGQAN